MKGHGLDTGSYSWSVSPVPGLRILGLDTSIIDHDNGEIPQTELKWIKEEVAEYPHDTVITLSHHLFLPTWENRDIPKWRKKYLLKNYQEVNAILEGAPQVKACLMGYHHQPNKAETHGTLAYIVHLADVISCMLGIGLGSDGLMYEVEENTLDVLGINKEDV